MLTNIDVTSIVPVLRDGAPTIGALTNMVMTSSGTYFTEVLEVGRYNEILAFLFVSANSGTTPTLDIKFQGSPDKVHWTDLNNSFTQVTTTNSQTITRLSAFGRYIRGVITLGGTTPSYTLSLTLIAKIGSGLVNQSIYDTSGNQLVSLATALDKVNDSITARPEGTTPVDLTSSTNAVVTGSGMLVGMYVNSTSSGTIKIYDSLTQANTVLNNTITPGIGSHNLFVGKFSTGLSVTIGGTLDVTLYYIPTP